MDDKFFGFVIALEELGSFNINSPGNLSFFFIPSERRFSEITGYKC